MWMFLAAFLQACTHYAEDLPPRVSGDIMWTDKRTFFCGRFRGGWGNQCQDLTYRAFRGILTICFGMIDEWIASPRLLPLFWSIVPVYGLARACNVKGPTITVLNDIYRMSKMALEKQPRLIQQQRVAWDGSEGRLVVTWERFDEDPRQALCWLGQLCDSTGVNPNSW